MKAPGGPVLVIGAGGHAKVVIATLRAAGYEVSGAVDDDQAKWGTELLGVRVTGPIASLDMANRRAVIAIGTNSIRKKLASELKGVEWLAVIHPSALVHRSVRVAEGTVVFAGAVIQPDAAIGSHAIINTAATVDHDCNVGEFAHLAPGVHLAGEVRIGAGAMLGIGAVVTPGRTIGEWSVIGAGSVVVRDVPARVTAVGVPAIQVEGKAR